MKILSLYAKINSDGNLVDSVLNHGNQNINFLEMDRIFYLRKKKTHIGELGWSEQQGIGNAK
jgi:hypothetical protein